MAATLKEWRDKIICVVTCDGRILTGKFVGHDQVQNVILNDAEERVYAEDSEPEVIELGLYMIRGDNVCMIAEFDPKSWKNVAAPPLPPIQQQIT